MWYGERDTPLLALSSPGGGVRELKGAWIVLPEPHLWPVGLGRAGLAPQQRTWASGAMLVVSWAAAYTWDAVHTG